jgi:magnesium-transporting ATPase (P-type)
MTDAAVMIFIVTAAVSMLVGMLGEALVALALLFAACFVSGRMNFASRRHALRMAENLLPTVKLLSEGNVKDVDCRELSVGDVIILLKGDVVPADCRLIYSSRLKVAEYFTDVVTAKRRARAVEKDANALYGEGDERESYDNMIYAGSTVISGKCRLSLSQRVRIRALPWSTRALCLHRARICHRAALLFQKADELLQPQCL